jgi:hypothetical protein
MLKAINLHAGAVDVGSEYMPVAVYNGPTTVFTTMPAPLHEVATRIKWLGCAADALGANCPA